MNLLAKWFVIPLLTIQSIFFFVAYYQGANLLPDSLEFLAFFNENLPIQFATKRPFFYPLILFLFGVVGTLLLQNLMLLIIVFRLSTHLFQNQKPNYLVAVSFLIALVFSLNIFIYANKIMAETLAMFMLWMAFEALQKQKIGWFLGCIALLPFVKPVFLFLPVLLFLIFLLHKTWRQKTILFGLLACFGLSLLYMTYNFKRTGAFEFSSIQHINALQYNKHQFDVARFGAQKAKAIQDSVILEGEKLAYPLKVKLYNNALSQEMKTHPIQYAVFHIKGAIRGIVDPGRFDVKTIFPAISDEGFLHRKGDGLWAYLQRLDMLTLLLLLPIALFNVLRFAFAVFGFVKSDKSLANIFAALSIFYVVAISGPINASRFMVPVVPFLLLFAFMGLEFFSHKITDSSTSPTKNA